ncbi:MAG: hypothetical protein H6713_08255 [Myxococcales bacterium]|nr:hypothetical protein [Myxococcales bacterium]MCB9749980.1 hypothetical protein [Myxococcales bacterium]
MPTPEPAPEPTPEPTSARRADALLRGLYRGLEALYGLESGVDPVAHLHPVESSAGAGREALVLRESPDGLEVALAIDAGVLRRLESVEPARALMDERLADTLPVLEGLSHLLYVAEAARRERPFSGLELETQAEVDKLALCVLNRWERWPQAREQYAALVDRLFYRFRLADDLGPGLRARYQRANRLALGFSRQLGATVERGEYGQLRRLLRRFWSASMDEKRGLAQMA